MAAAAAAAVLACMAGAPSMASAASPALFRVGAAVRSLNPSVPVYAGGFSLSPPITTVHDPIEVRAFYVSNGQRAVEVAVVDSQAYFAAYQEGPDYGITSVRADAAREIDSGPGPKMTQADIIVQGTHGHADPTLEGIWGPVPPAYLKQVHDQTVAALAAAAAQARPAYLQWGTLDDRNIAAVNIDQDSYQGWANDTQISVLRGVSPRDGSTVALLANIPVHGAQVCGECLKLLSADYFGVVRTDLDRALGGTAVVGPATLGREESPVETTGLQNMQWLSGVITNDVEQAVAHASWVTNPTITSAESFIQVPATNGALLALNRAWSLPDSAKQQEAASSGIYPIDRDDSPPYLNGNVLGTYLTSLRIGDIALVSMPGEPFPEIRHAIVSATNAHGVVALSKGQDDWGYFYAAWAFPSTFVYQSDHHIFSVAPQAGDQIFQDELPNMARLGFATSPSIVAPGNTDYSQKLKPGMQALASPPTGDADAGGHFTSTLQAIYMPASFIDAPLIGPVHWDFGDGTQANTGYLVVGQDYGQTGQGPAGQPLFAHSFPVGTHTVTASGRDTTGSPASWTFTVTVYPHLSATASCSPGPGGSVVLSAAPSGGQGTVIASHWQLGDGTTAAGLRVAHTFAGGSPSGTVTMVDGAGGQASASVDCAAAGAGVIGLRSPGRCLSVRTLTIHLHLPAGTRARSVRIRIGRRRPLVLRGARLTAPINLRGLPPGRFRVRVVVRLTNGRRVVLTRRYRTCTPKRISARRRARRRRVGH